jgi:hypothetical protein
MNVSEKIPGGRSGAAQRKDEAYWIRRLCRRIRLLEGDAALARRMVAGMSEDNARDVKWLDSIARIEAQIHRLYEDVIERMAGAAQKSGSPPAFTVITSIPRPGARQEQDDDDSAGSD